MCSIKQKYRREIGGIFVVFGCVLWKVINLPE